MRPKCRPYVTCNTRCFGTNGTTGSHYDCPLVGCSLQTRVGDLMTRTWPSRPLESVQDLAVATGAERQAPFSTGVKRGRGGARGEGDRQDREKRKKGKHGDPETEFAPSCSVAAQAGVRSDSSGLARPYLTCAEEPNVCSARHHPRCLREAVSVHTPRALNRSVTAQAPLRHLQVL